MTRLATLALAIALAGCSTLPEGVDAYDVAREQTITLCRLDAACMTRHGYGWPPAWYVPTTTEDES